MIVILTAIEVAIVATTLRKKARDSVCHRCNLAFFRLVTGAGLRRCEAIGLDMRDVILDGPQPCITIRGLKGVTKGRFGKYRSRTIPLNWDSGTLDDIKGWAAYRRGIMRAKDNDPFLCCTVSVTRGIPTLGKRLPPRTANSRWKTCLKILGEERQRQVHLHCGRHTFCSHSLHVGHSLNNVREAMGHSNLQTTSLYSHTLEDMNAKPLYPDA